VVSTPSGIMKAYTDKLTMGAEGVVESFQGLRLSHSGEVRRIAGKVLS